MDSIRTKEEEREYLRKLIGEWNASRLDIFVISEPNENLEYRGVMRFFFQDAHAGAKMATKCIRVSSVETAEDVTNTLVEKFRPDMKMLTNPNYSLYEVHPDGDSRKLALDDRPLVVQLSWQKDDREGRFLLKSDSEALVTTNVFKNDENDPGQSFKRKLSKREKKELKKKKEEEAKKAKILGPSSPTKTSDDSALAQTVYNELPETSFTRSISNPEIVMKMRRQRKLERKLQEFQNSEGGADSGGTLKIFAETLKPEIPYKTLLVSMRDPTTHIVKEALEKYQMEKENPDDYCLVMVNIPPGGTNGASTLGKERVVHDEDNPLAIAATWPKNQGHVVFHLRRRSNLPQYRKQKRRSKSPSRVPLDNTPDKKIGERLATSYPEHLLPYLREVSSDGRELDYKSDVFRLPMEVTEVGSDKGMSSGGSYLEIFAAQGVLPRHCVITNMDGIVSVTPSTGDAEVYVDGRRIYESTKLNHGSMVKFGRLHTFRFGDPAFEEISKPLRSPGPDGGSISSGHSDTDLQKRRDYRPAPGGLNREYEQNRMEMTNNHESGMFETTFGVDGEIETYTNEKPPYERPDQPPQIIHTPPDSPTDDGMGDKLPARLEFRESGEDAFFAAVISEVNGDRVHFKLAPTYTLYMCCRYRTSPAYREELTRHQRSERLSLTVQKVANMVRSTVEENSQLPGSLAFWMANSSELLHFLKQDVDISPYLKDNSQLLAQSVQMAFRHLVQCVEQELRTLMSAFLDITEDADMEDSDGESMMDPDAPDNLMTGERSFRYGPSGRPIGGDSWLGGRRRHGKPTVSDILFTLSSAMSLLRRCRVNAAITIQVFSQLFHYINMWIFNKLVLQPQLGLCTRDWGHRLRRRLGRVETWAQKQGLELAADCHLCRVVQAAHLLQSPKNSRNDINSLSSACFKLNSVQLRVLLENYRPAPDELDIPRDLIDSVVAVAENTADELLRNQGQEVTLEEDPQLQLPFLLPEDRYSCEVIRGVPPGLKEFLNPLAGIGLCRLTIQPSSSGLWTVYHLKYRDTGGDLAPKGSQTPEIVDISFNKGQRGMGLSIVAAKGAGQDKLGIYIKQVVKDGPAARDGRLQAGDQLLAVNGESLVGVPQERAAELMVKSGSNVTLRIAKQGAIYHGLATLLSQPSPMISREPQQKLVAVDNEELVQASPTISEQEMQRSPGRWLQQDRDQSFNRWGDEDRGGRYQDQWQIDEDRRRRDGDEERRRIEEQRRQAEEERRLEEERIGAERERRYREEEERRLEEERRKAEEEKRKLEEERRLEEQRRRAEEQRRLEEERRRAEEQKLEEERRREEERRLEEQRLYAEEQRRIEEARQREERRLAEEQQRLDEERRREEERRIDEQRRFNEERRRQEVERKRAEDALKMIGEQQRRQKPFGPRASPQAVQVEPVRSPYRVRFDESDKERQKSPLTVKIEEPEVVAQNRGRVYAAPVSPGSTSPRRGSPREDNSPDEPPSSPIRIDSRNSRQGRIIMVTQSQIAAGGVQPARPGEGEPDRKPREPQDNWRPHEKEEFASWQQDESKLAEERERREEEERAWRFHLEKQRRDQDEYSKREKERLGREKQEREQRLEREKQEWERARAERERQERERQERERRDRERQELERIERDRVERERGEREREERERLEEERIMNQLQKEELDEQRERENHMRQLEEEQVQLRSMEQARLKSSDKGSKEYLDLIESLSPDEVEREFKKRLEEERKRKEVAGDEEERTAGGLVSVTRVKYHPPDKEERMERGRKIDLLLDETMRRERERKEAEKRRQQKDEEEERIRSERQQRRIQQFEMDREQQREAQRRIQEQREREQEEWLRQQREKRDQQRMDQEKLRLEKKMQEEEERNKKRLEIQQRREQEERLRRDSQRQKDEQERLLAEEQREAELRRDFERRKQLEEQRIIKEKEEQLRKQQMEDQELQEGRTRKPSTEEHVNELKSRATADYERRRKLIDEEINRRRPEPVSVLKNSGSSKPKKQVSFSNVATEIREPASPTYVVGTPSGYTARVTPAPSVRLVNTRAPNDEELGSARPPLPDDDDDLPPPPPPPPPPDELLEDDGFPPPPPMKSSQSFDRYNALNSDPRTRSLGYTSRVTIPPQGPRDTPGYPTAYSSTGVPLRQPPITSSSAYPSYVTLPRKPRPVSYPAPFEMNQQGPPPPPARYGSQENVLDGPSSRSQSYYAPKPARLDNDDVTGSDIARGRLARMSLTDEEKSENQFVSKKPENLHFRDKLKIFNKESPEEKIRASRWQQEQMSQLNGDVTSP